MYTYCMHYMYLVRWSMQFPKPGHWPSIFMRLLVFSVSHHTDPSFVAIAGMKGRGAAHKGLTLQSIRERTI